MCQLNVFVLDVAKHTICGKSGQKVANGVIVVLCVATCGIAFWVFVFGVAKSN